MCVCQRNEQKRIKHSEKLKSSPRPPQNQGRKPREDFNQAAVRRVEEDAEKHCSSQSATGPTDLRTSVFSELQSAVKPCQHGSGSCRT